MPERKYLLVAKNVSDVQNFTKLNDIKPSEFMLIKYPRMFSGKQDVVAIFLDGWRERKDATLMITAANQAEIRNVKIVFCAADGKLPQ